MIFSSLLKPFRASARCYPHSFFSCRGKWILFVHLGGDTRHMLNQIALFFFMIFPEKGST
jgi:hypothetical protein